MYPKITFSIKNIFSLASRERCITNIQKLALKRYGKLPSATTAVLVPLCNVAGVPSLLFTIRSSNLRSNNGEVSFPGGKVDVNESPVQTALRETYNAIGLSQSKIQVWGQGPALPGSNNKLLITPVIGSVSSLSQEDLNINTKEVSEAFTVPIEILCDPENQYYTQFSNGYILPVFVAESYKIWGVTAYITHSFLNCVLSKDVYRNEWMKKKIIIDKAL